MSMVNKERRQVRQAMMSGLRWIVALRLIAQTTSWIITLVVIRLLTPGDYGLQAMVGAIYALLLLLTQSGLDRAIARDPEFGASHLSQILGFSLVLNSLVIVAVWLAAPYVAMYYQEEAVVPVLRTLAFGLAITIFKSIPIGMVWRRLDYRTHAIANLAGTITSSLTTLIMALFGFGVWALIMGTLVAPAVSALYLQFRTRWLVRPQLTIAKITPLIKYMGTVSLSFFVWALAMRMAILIGGQQLSAMELGFYAVATHLCSLPASKVLPLANQVLYPAYAKLQNDSTAANTYFSKALASLCLVLFPVFLGLAAIAEWLSPVLFGSKWSGVEQIIIIVAVAMPFRVVTVMCNPILHATGNAARTLTSGMFSVVFVTVAFAISVRWGVAGLAWATLATSPVIMGIVLWQTRQSTGLSLPALARSLGPPLLVSVLMALAVYFIGARAAAVLPNATVVAIQVVAGVLIYFGAAWLFAHDLLLSTASILRTSLKRRKKAQ